LLLLVICETASGERGLGLCSAGAGAHAIFGQVDERRLRGGRRLSSSSTLPSLLLSVFPRLFLFIIDHLWHIQNKTRSQFLSITISGYSLPPAPSLNAQDHPWHRQPRPPRPPARTSSPTTQSCEPTKTGTPGTQMHSTLQMLSSKHRSTATGPRPRVPETARQWQTATCAVVR